MPSKLHLFVHGIFARGWQQNAHKEPGPVVEADRVVSDRDSESCMYPVSTRDAT